MTIPQKIWTGFCLTFLILVIMSTVSYRNSNNLVATAERVKHTHEVLGSLVRVLSLLQDAEVGQRGYLLTSDKAYLEPYSDALNQISLEVAHLTTLTLDNQNQQHRIKQRLQPLIDEKLAELKKTIDLHGMGDTQEALEVVKSDRGKEAMDGIRVVIAEMQKEERDLLGQRSDAAKSANTTAMAVGIIATIMALALVLVAGFFITRSTSAEIASRERAEGAIRASQNELAIKNGIARVFLTVMGSKVYEEVLDILLRAFESRFGYFGYIDEHGSLVCPSMTQDIWHECQIEGKDIVFPRSSWGGLWGRSLTEQKSLFSNQDLRLPEGHIQLRRAMVAPIIYDREPIGQFAVANGSCDYTEADVKLLESLADYVAPLLHSRLENERLNRERRRAEDALRESQKRYQTLAEVSPDAVYQTDPLGNCVYANERWLEMSGMTLAETLGDGWKRAVHSEDADRFSLEWSRAISEGQPFKMEYRLNTPDGVVVPVLGQSRAERDKDGEITGHVGTLTDITERKLAEKAIEEERDKLEQRVKERTLELENANRELRAEIIERQQVEDVLRTQTQIIDQIHDSVVSTDLDGNVTSWSTGAERSFGYSADEALGKHISFVYGEDQHEFLQTDVIEPLKRKGEHNVEVRMRRKSGMDFYAHLSLSLLRDRDGKVIGMIGYSMDITERKKAADRIQLDLHVQEVTSAILRLTLESVSQGEFFAETLDLILSLPWLVSESKGCIFLVGEDRKELKMVAQRGLPPQLLAACGTLPFGKCLCGRSAATREIMFACDVDDRHEVRYPGMPSHGHYCIPIISEKRLLGLLNLYVAAGHKRAPEEEVFLGSVANLLAITLQRQETEEALRAKEAQLIAAAEIQEFLLPKDSVTLPGFSIAGRCYPAEIAAGDHFNYLELPDGSLLVVVGDVSGHGVGPALITAAFHTQFKILADQLSDPAEMVAKVNAVLDASTKGEMFVTLIAGRIDPKSRTLTYVNAGHPPGLIFDSAGNVKASLEAKNVPLAILREVDFILGGPVQLVAGDILLFLTDGAIEAQSRGGPMFGLERAYETVRQNRDKTPNEIVEALYAAVCQHQETERLRDDVTIVVAKVEPTEEEGIGGVVSP